MTFINRFVIAGLMLSFITAANASVVCLSGKAAQNTLLTDKAEPYFSLLQPREMAAKTGALPKTGSLQRQREQVRVTYRHAVLDCTAGELKGLESYISIIDTNVAKSYPGLVSLPWRFVKVSNNIEGGLPHTRGSVIVLSERMLRVINETAQTGYLRTDIMEILIHEQMHVLQRARPKVFEALYEQWGFRKVRSIRGAERWLTAHQIVNPDGIDVLWVWPVPGTKRVIWPRVILDGESARPAMPKDLRMVGIELASSAKGYSVYTNKQGIPLYHELSEEPAYQARFSGSSSLYHPNEIAADYLSGLVMWDTLVDKSKLPAEQQAEVEETFKAIRGWAHQNFGH